MTTIACPKCSTPVKGGTGLGMVECSNCGEYILLGGDQLPELKDLGQEPAPQAPAFSFDLPSPPEAFGAAGANETAEPLFPLQNNVDSVGMIEMNAGAEAPALIAPESIDPDPLKTTVLEIEMPRESLPTSPSPQFQDVLDFGNQAQPSQGFGGLVYDIRIGGVDTADIRRELSQCLDDKRLQMDARALMSKIKNGELVLEKVNPVKASVILNRLRHFPFKITWSSHQLIKNGKTVLMMLVAGALFSVGLKLQASEWARHEVNLKGYAIKIENEQDTIRELIQKKKNAKTVDEQEALIKEIVKENEALKKLYKEFKDEKEHVRFEHPEQGDKTERKYRHVKLKSLEELQNEVGLDGQLSRIKKKVETTYEEPEASPSKK